MELLITKPRSFRQNNKEIDEEIFSDICSRLPNTPRGRFRTRINHKLNFPTEKELEDATTTILQKMWEGNHLLEYFNAVAQTIPVLNLEKILHQYGFAKKGNDFVKFGDFKRHFSDGFGGNKPKKLFFSLATAQQISVLKCLVQFLDFCLKENRPLQYFYTDKEKSFNQYIEFANDALKRSNATNNEINILLQEEDRLILKNYIDRTNEFLKENPERGFPQSDFDSEQHISDCLSSERLPLIPSPSFQSTEPRLTIPQKRGRNPNYFANAVLDVIGRDEQKARLKAFLEYGKNVAWFQLAGVAGQGKSRLAFDLIKVAEELGFRAGFLTENDIRFFKDQWKDWQPDKPYLLIFDYVIGREEQIKLIFQILIFNQDNYRHNIRILLVERQRWDHGSEIKAQHQNNKDSIGLSRHIGDKAPWFLNLCAGDDPRGERLLEPCRFENGVEELKKLDQEDLVTIVKQLSGKELTLSDDALKQTLERIDNTGRPLYAYLLAQQLSESEAGYRNWTKIDLLNYQLIRDKDRWGQVFKEQDKRAPTWGDSDDAMKLAVLATIVRQVNLEDEIIKSSFGETSVSLGREAMAITSSYLINDDNNPHKIYALEPDLLGEWFVLFCFYKRLKFEELLNLAWKYSPNETAIFLQRITQDFIDLSEKYGSWNLTEKLLAYVPFQENFSQEKYYQALAKVAVPIAGELYRRDIKIPENIIISLEFAAKFDTDAMYYLGFFYSNGIGVTKDSEKVVDLLQRVIEKGGEQGNYVALNNLGVSYQNGDGVKQDFVKAVELYSKAAKQGYGAAMRNLGLCYQNGNGVDQNWNKATDLFRGALNAGEDEAVDNIRDIHLRFFLGEGNYEIHKTYDWVKNMHQYLPKTPAFDPPIVSGNWRLLTDKEVIDCFNKLTASFEILEIIDSMNGCVCQYGRWLPLSFYDGCYLVDIQICNPLNGNTVIFSAVINDIRGLLLGDPHIIYELNQYLLSLYSKELAIDYLRFLGAYAHSNNGPIQIISDVNEIPLKNNVTLLLPAEDGKEFSFKPKFIEGSFEKEGWQQLEVWALLQNGIYISTFKVFSNGNFDIEEEIFISELLVLQRQYHFIFRTPLRPLNS